MLKENKVLQEGDPKLLCTNRDQSWPAVSAKQKVSLLLPRTYAPEPRQVQLTD